MSDIIDGQAVDPDPAALDGRGILRPDPWRAGGAAGAFRSEGRCAAGIFGGTQPIRVAGNNFPSLVVEPSELNF